VTFLDFKNYPLWINIMVFALSAGVVWFAGTRLSRYADTISRQTGIGQAMIGLLLVGGITSLPEIAVTGTSAFTGNAALAVNNVLGGVAMQVVILAAADAAIGRDALTRVVADPMLLLQGALCAMLLTFVAAAVIVGDVLFFGIGAWSWSILAVFLVSLRMISKSQGRYPWHPDGKGWHQHPGEKQQSVQEGRRKSDDDHKPPLGRTIAKTIAVGAVILVAGFFTSRTADAFAEQTGLGASFVGAALLPISTSLPELSTVLAAVRLRSYGLAVSEIFGTNLFDVAIVFWIDAVYQGGPVLNEVGKFSTFGALLGIFLTMLYLAGLIERRDRTILRMGIDSLVVLVAYPGGLILLYQFR
jgi:cation:H+ antiporter